MNTGKQVASGHRSTDNRKLASLATALVATLKKNLPSYGLELSAVFVRDSTGLQHKINLERDVINVEHNAQHAFDGKKASSFSALSSDNPEVAKNIVALLDDHYVSDKFWKQLSGCLPDLPSLRLLNSFRQESDSRTEIIRTPGQFRGAQVFFEEELRQTIKDLCRRVKKRLLN